MVSLPASSPMARSEGSTGEKATTCEGRDVDYGNVRQGRCRHRERDGELDGQVTV